MAEFKELFEFLNSSFVLLIGGGLLRAIYVLFQTVIQTNDNTKDIAELQEFCGFHERRVTDGFRKSGTSSRE